MPTSESPTDVNEPKEPAETSLGPESPGPGGPNQESLVSTPAPQVPALSPGSSRWVDYNTHELLEMISDLEDERRWARLREGVL